MTSFAVEYGLQNTLEKMHLPAKTRTLEPLGRDPSHGQIEGRGSAHKTVVVVVHSSSFKEFPKGNMIVCVPNSVAIQSFQ